MKVDMSVTHIVGVIDSWKNQKGQCPTFTDLHVAIGGYADTLRGVIADAEKLGIIYMPQTGRYDYHPTMI